MLWNDNWGWAWMALIIAMAGLWVHVIWSVATAERDSCAECEHHAPTVGRTQRHRGAPCRPVPRA
jgi:hypothetical protein